MDPVTGPSAPLVRLLLLAGALSLSLVVVGCSSNERSSPVASTPSVPTTVNPYPLAPVRVADEEGWVYRYQPMLGPLSVRAEKTVKDSPPGKACVRVWFDTPATWGRTGLDPDTPGRNPPPQEVGVDAYLRLPLGLDEGWSPRERHCSGGEGLSLYDCVQSDRPDYFFPKTLDGLVVGPYLRCPTVTYSGSDGEFRQWFAEGPEDQVDTIVAAMNGPQQPVYAVELGDFCSASVLADGRLQVDDSPTCAVR